ncbi:MAG: hypothetical protein KJ659_01760 [Actinobacteria bacterium]|nr:hypothetical protein [Actinomycetota bacterium]MBU1607737.1 hypothetical protein [Actinomycetota bacterium]MBU2314591.1 hypothetical protein [Actinomycetota bacterium]MBU2384214.1 hypothetical protein [Actinomycetota bacterium]
MSILPQDPNDLPPPAPRRRRLTVLTAVGIVCVGGIIAAGAIYAASASQTPRESKFPLMEYTTEPTLPPDLRLVDEFDEGLVSDAIDLDVMNWLNGLQLAVMNDPNFGTVAISPDRMTVTITWYRELSTTLQQQIDLAPDGIEVVIQPAAFQPADLQELIARAMVPDLLAGIRITMGGAENDGSGLRFGIWELPKGGTLDGIAEQLAHAIGRPDIPITVEVAQIVPANS